MKFQVGDKVITQIDCEPYYSRYSGNPIVRIPKGTTGVIAATHCPYVNKQGYFNCVDFTIPNVFSGNPKYNNNIWRASLIDKELKLV